MAIRTKRPPLPPLPIENNVAISRRHSWLGFIVIAIIVILTVVTTTQQVASATTSSSLSASSISKFKKNIDGPIAKRSHAAPLLAVFSNNNHEPEEQENDYQLLASSCNGEEEQDDTSTHALIKVELYTDLFPWETQWKVEDHFSNNVFFEGGPYSERGALYTEERCVRKEDSCYSFTITDTSGNGLCCGTFYRITYDGIIIHQGGIFEYSETSPFFGDACERLPSPEPSTSLNPSKSPRPSQTPTMCDQAIIKIEVFTDNNTDEVTSLLLLDVVSYYDGDTGYFLLNDALDDVPPLTLYSTELCVEKSGCYQFAIQNENGICCDNGNGFYRLYFDGLLIQEGGEDFNFNPYDVSPFFGDLCPTAAPSISLEPSSSPSLSLNPTMRPSKNPSFSPTESTLPTLDPSSNPSFAPTKSAPPTIGPSDNPSFFPTKSDQPTIEPTLSLTPTLTSLPTITPTELPNPEFTKDILGRRHFPPRPIHPKSADGGSLPYQVSPDCTNGSLIGCVAFPKPRIMTKVNWAGKLFQREAECSVNKNGRNRKCNPNIPVSKNLVPTFLTPSSSGFHENNIIFVGEQDRGVGGKKWSVAVGDLDGDGLVDIVAGNRWIPNQIFYSLGGGEFDDPVDIPGGSYYTSRSFALDIDGDGRKDIVTINNDIYDRNDPSYILWNEGNREFTLMDLPGDTPTDIAASSVGFMDLNKDGKLDLVVAMEGKLNVLLFNVGRRRFGNMVILPGNPTSHSVHVAFADVDNDSNIDIVIGNRGIYEDGVYSDSENDLLLNKGDGTFEHSFLPGGSAQTNSVAVADIDDDGLVDIVIGNRHGQLLWNKGNGAFNVTDLPGAKRTRSVHIADVDGEGKLDIVVINEDNPHFILRYVDDKNFHRMDLPYINEFEGVYDTAIEDFDGNNMLDILFLTSHMPKIMMNFVDGRSTQGKDFVAIDFPGTPQNTVAIGIAPLNDNDDLDVFVGNFRKSNQFILMNSDGSIAETITLSSDSDNIETTCIIPMTNSNNGAINLFIGNKSRTQNVILLNTGDGLFDLKYIAESFYVSTLSAASGDLNNDGFVDLVIGNQEEANQILLNNGNDKFRKIDIPGTESKQTTCISLGDLNGDNLLDIVLGNGNNEAQSNYILINKGDGTEFEISELPGGNTITRSIVVGNLHDSNRLDIVVGNHHGTNLILFNNGNTTFEVKQLPGDAKFTNALALGDMDGDSNLDVIISNGYLNNPESNEIIFNLGGGDFVEHTIPGSVSDTRAVALSDFDGDGRLDMVFGNYGTANNVFFQSICKSGGAQLHSRSWCYRCPQFMARENTRFGRYTAKCRECMPDHSQSDFSETCALNPCLNGERSHGSNSCIRCAEGTFYNTSVVREEDNPSSWESKRCVDCPQGSFADWLLPAIDQCSMCPAGTYNDEEGGSQKSDCIHCREGTYSTITGANSSSTCIECLPGSYSNVTGQTGCIRCPKGTYQPGSGSTGCIPCSSGTFTDVEGQTKCTECPIGSSQINTEASECINCIPGTFQSLRGQPTCDPCEAGSYCDPTDTTCTLPCPCHPGTYNDEEGKSQKSDCILCEAGTYSTITGANSPTTCLECLPGSYTNIDGQTECIRCPEGSSQGESGSIECIPCKGGTYTDAEGQTRCSQCPYRLSSTDNSTSCGFCAEGFYLKDPSVGTSDIFLKPSEHCLECPEDVECPFNTTLQSLVVPPNHWRDSLDTSTVYRCDNLACQGFSPKEIESSYSDTDKYCIDGHSGPLCQVCRDSSEYFKEGKECKKCPSMTLLATPIGIIMAIIGSFVMIDITRARFKQFEYFFSRIGSTIFSIGLQAKFKTLISFIQVFNTFEDVYGVVLNEKLQAWVGFLHYLNFGLLEMTSIPGKCFGSMKVRLVITGLWPYFVLVFTFMAITVYEEIIRWRRNRSQQNNRTDLKRVLWVRFIQTSIFIFYLSLPSVSRGIFDAIKCQSFQTNDEKGTSSSYLSSDLSIRCGKDSESYQDLQRVFWGFVTLWPIMIPLVFFGLLMRVRGSVRSRSITPLAEASSFLWRDYKESCMFWEFIDVTRKIFLTGFIMFIDTNEGSRKILRLVIANIVSAMYLSILAYARPYSRKNDLYLSFISNFFIICCFALGTIIQLCDSDNNGTCQDFVGLRLDSYNASLLAVMLTFSMLFITAFFIIVLAYNQITSPIIKLKRTNQYPNMEMGENCTYHVFCSHIWSSGQDKTHSMVQKLQLYLPGIKIWLDVNNLKDVDDLEQSVEESAVFVLFYTKKYFASPNCRREINMAVSSRKPTITLYENYTDIDAMVSEIRANYRNDFQLVLDHIFQNNDVVLWLGRSGSHHAIESTKLLSQKILTHLPIYIRHPNLLQEGLTIASEMGIVKLQKNCQLLYCAENIGSDRVANELRAMTRENEDIEFLSVLEADIIFDTTFVPKNHYLLLYLADGMFGSGDRMKEKIKHAIDTGINILLVHEQNPEKGGVKFHEIMSQTPTELIGLNLYNEMAFPLHSFEAYRTVSLRQILSAMS